MRSLVDAPTFCAATPEQGCFSNVVRHRCPIRRFILDRFRINRQLLVRSKRVSWPSKGGHSGAVLSRVAESRRRLPVIDDLLGSAGTNGPLGCRFAVASGPELLEDRLLIASEWSASIELLLELRQRKLFREGLLVLADGRAWPWPAPEPQLLAIAQSATSETRMFMESPVRRPDTGRLTEREGRLAALPTNQRKAALTLFAVFAAVVRSRLAGAISAHSPIERCGGHDHWPRP